MTYIQVLNVITMRWVLSKKERGREGIDFINIFPNFFKFILLISLIILLASFIPVKVLLAKDFRTNEYLDAWPITDGDSFSVLYTHSVQLCPVSETYIIRDENIILTETYFESFGAGLPSSTPYKFEITSTGFRIYEINELMDKLVYRTGAVRANHVLELNNKEYAFLEFSKPRTGVEFLIKDLSILSYLARGY